MKFYRDKRENNFSYLILIKINKLTAIYHNYYYIAFFKNAKLHNDKNASYIYEHKDFRLNNVHYGHEDDFTKESWRRLVKMNVFL